MEMLRFSRKKNIDQSDMKFILPSGTPKNLVNRNILVWNGDFYHFKAARYIKWMKKADHCVEILYIPIALWKLIYYLVFWKVL